MSDLHLAIHVGHDSNTAVVAADGEITFTASEERFIRQKQYPGYPKLSLEHIRKVYGNNFSRIYTVRMPAAQRLLREINFYARSYGKGLTTPNFRKLIGLYWKKIRKGRTLEQKDSKGDNPAPFNAEKTINVEHHLAHAASAFYPSGFEKACIFTLDGEGDLLSGGFYTGGPEGIERHASFFYNEVTIGRDYEKVTAMLGFHPLRHPGKVTGLAAFGNTSEACKEKLKSFLAENWKSAAKAETVTQHSYQVITQRGRDDLIKVRKAVFKEFSDEDMACAIQEISEERIIELLKKHVPEGTENIALAGGVFANVKINKMVKDFGFKRIFIQPAMTDQGLSLGAALYDLGQTEGLKPKRIPDPYRGPAYEPDEIKKELESFGFKYTEEADMAGKAAELLAQGKVIARFDGRMEYGPRALGNRSILYQTTDVSVNDWLNRKLKRTEFMPFAPVTPAEEAARCYKGIEGAEYTAKFMTITFDCTEEMKKMSPAVVHVDGTARPQIVSQEDNPEYYEILRRYQKLTGIPNLINTSFNMHEEPIVCSPYDALRAFKLGHLDYLIAGPFLVEKP